MRDASCLNTRVRKRKRGAASYLHTYLLYRKLGGTNANEERPKLHDVVDRWTPEGTLDSFAISGGGGDSQRAPLHAEGSREAAQYLPYLLTYLLTFFYMTKDLGRLFHQFIDGPRVPQRENK